jgi:hypothetical protein
MRPISPLKFPRSHGTYGNLEQHVRTFVTAANIFDFEALFKNDISINFGPVLVPEDMIANHEQCNFFLLALNAMCSVDETDLPESEPEGDYLTCHLTSLSKGSGTPLRIVGLFRRLFQRQIIGR